MLEGWAQEAPLLPDDRRPFMSDMVRRVASLLHSI